jgi:hypothetical protein
MKYDLMTNVTFSPMSDAEVPPALSGERVSKIYQNAADKQTEIQN